MVYYDPKEYGLIWLFLQVPVTFIWQVSVVIISKVLILSVNYQINRRFLNNSLIYTYFNLGLLDILDS